MRCRYRKRAAGASRKQRLPLIVVTILSARSPIGREQDATARESAGTPRAPEPNRRARKRRLRSRAATADFYHRHNAGPDGFGLCAVVLGNRGFSRILGQVQISPPQLAPRSTIPGHAGINLPRPCVDAALQRKNTWQSEMLEHGHCRQAANAVVAVRHDECTRRWLDFWATCVELVEREQDAVRQGSRLMFPALANV